MDPVLGFSSSSTLTSSSRLLEDIVTELECPVSLDLLDSAVTFSCMHTFHENFVKELCGPDKDNPKLGSKCPLCDKPIKFWNKNFAVESLVGRVQLLQEKMRTEEKENREEFDRLKIAEEYWRIEYSRIMIMQKLHQGEYHPQTFAAPKVVEEQKIYRIPKVSLLGTLMQCVGIRQIENETWL